MSARPEPDHLKTARPATADWTADRERSNFLALRVMRWIAVAAGRPIARLVLHPIALYFLLANGKARRASRAYLARALGRPAGWRDAYRHIHAFAATILDRVYFLQERHDQFVIGDSGAEAMWGPLARGDGVMMVGAHLGSFEALRASAHGRGAKVAMLMYEQNARLINAALAAVAPHAELHTIALGKPGAMLALRRWLDQGGLAGLLADRTLPGHSERSRTTMLDFLGRPARFSDGPFRLAAMLRRQVVFMAGLYVGGNRYELRFVELADFRPETPAGELSTEARIEEALRRYVALLESLCREAPYNWFNFFDFWANDDADFLLHPDRRRLLAGLLAGLLATGAACDPAHAQAPRAFDLPQLMQALAQVKSGTATFTETRNVAMLERSLQSSGRLSFAAPDTFVRETLKPRTERIAVVGNSVTMSLGGSRSRTVPLDSVPEAAVIMEAIRGTLTGNRDALEKNFQAAVSGTPQRWSLELKPREPRLRELVVAVTVSGANALVRQVAVQMADGDRSTMTIEPVATDAARPAASASN